MGGDNLGRMSLEPGAKESADSLTLWGQPGGWVWDGEHGAMAGQQAGFLGASWKLGPQELAWHWGMSGAWVHGGQYESRSRGCWPGTGEGWEPGLTGASWGYGSWPAAGTGLMLGSMEKWVLTSLSFSHGKGVFLLSGLPGLGEVSMGIMWNWLSYPLHCIFLFSSSSQVL